MKSETISLAELTKGILDNKYNPNELDAIEYCLEAAKNTLPCNICIVHHSNGMKEYSVVPVNSHSPTGNETSIN